MTRAEKFAKELRLKKGIYLGEEYLAERFQAALDEERDAVLEEAISIVGGLSGPGNTVANAAGYTAACNEGVAALRALKSAKEKP